MTSDPQDDLLQQALELDAPGGDRAPDDPEGLVETARVIRASADQTNREASGAESRSRARFSRYLEQQSAPAQLAARRRAWWMGPVGRAGAVVAAAAAVVVVLVLVVPMLTGDVDTAAAQVLSPGDVVQVEGVVRDVPVDPQGDITVASDIGDISLRIGEASVVLESDEPVGRSELRAGDRVVVSGLVRADRRLDVSAIEIGARQQLPPISRPLVRLSRTLEAVDGRVVAVSIASDGETVRIVLVSGERWLLAETAASDAHALLNGGTTLGRDVHIRPGDPGSGRNFEIEAPQGDPPGRGIVGVRGIVGAASDGVLTVATLDGRIRVRISGNTTLRFANSGLDKESFDEGRGAIGRTIGANGRIDRETGEVLADVILLGRPPAILERR